MGKPIPPDLSTTPQPIGPGTLTMPGLPQPVLVPGPSSLPGTQPIQVQPANDWTLPPRPPTTLVNTMDTKTAFPNSFKLELVGFSSEYKIILCCIKKALDLIKSKAFLVLIRTVMLLIKNVYEINLNNRKKLLKRSVVFLFFK